MAVSRHRSPHSSPHSSARRTPAARLTRSLLGATAVAALGVTVGCSTDPVSDPAGPAVGTAGSAGSQEGIDPDPYDGVIGAVMLTPNQAAYRDRLGLTDAEAHDAFRYSCSVTLTPGTRFANRPPTTEEIS